MLLHKPRFPAATSLRGRLALLVLLVAAPAFILVAALTKRAYDQERTAVSRHLVTATRAVALLVERKFDSAEALLRGLASARSLEQGDLAAFEERVRATPVAADEWIVLIDPAGQQLMNTRLQAGQPLPRTEMEDGFWPAAQRGERHVSNVFVGPVANAPVLTVSIPVFRDGQLNYALVFAMLPSSLERAVAAHSITSGDIVAVIDRNGVIAVRNRNPERFIGQKARPELISAAAAQREGVFESDTLEGIASLSAFSRCGSIGWTVAIGAPRAELYASARGLLRVAAIWTAVIVALVCAVAAWIARSVIRGMDSLVADTVRIGVGEPPAGRRVGLHEVDVVAGALSATADKLSQRERELRLLNQTLEQRVASRTRELDQANRALQSANRELEDFARVAAHDLRQPLRSMISFAELLQAEHGAQLDAAGRDYLNRVCAAGLRLSGMLEAILAYSTASAAPLAPLQRVDLKHAVAAAEQDLAQPLQQTGGRIETGTLGSVDADPQQLHQLLLNLIGNGVKFHRPQVPPVVRVESWANEHWLHVTVSDNGIGFPPASAERIFAPFERLERRIQGSGIGLAIVRRIAERHGGSVRATSTPGEGSQFEVILPQRTPSTGLEAVS